MDKVTALQESFASAKVVIDTLNVNSIDEAIIQAEGAKTEFTVIHMGPMEEETSSPSMLTNNDRKVPVKGSNGDVVNVGNLDHDERRKDQDLDGQQGEREDEQSPTMGCISNSNLISNHSNDGGGPRDSPGDNINSGDEVENNNDLSDAGMEDDRSEEVLGESPLIEGEAEVVKGKLTVMRMNNDAFSDS